MPIRPENLARYPKNWKQIARTVKANAGWRCQFCNAAHGEPHPETKSKVVLTTAHLDHTPENCDLDNLRALCQKCHLNYDQEHHLQQRRINQQTIADKRNHSVFQ